MTRRRNIALLAAGGLLALIVLAAIAFVLLVDLNAQKPRLEAAASDALRMEVRIGGRLWIGFFPGFHVGLEDVRIRNRGTDVASAKEARLGIKLLPLLRKEVQVATIEMTHPRISIEKDRNGRFNFEPEKAEAGKARKSGFDLDLANVSLSDGAVAYSDRKTGETFGVGEFHLDVTRLRYAGKEKADFPRNLSISAKFACKEFRWGNLSASDLKFRVEGKDGVLVFDPVTMRLFGGQGTGSLRADFSGLVPGYDIRYSLSGFRIETLLKALYPKKAPEGPMDFSSSLSARGNSVRELKRTVNGKITLRGENLTLNGVDLDRVFSRYEASQNFNLVDVGAFFVAGPFAPLITKGYDFASIFRGSGGSSRIGRLVADWKVANGIALAEDVAMSTKENRIALKGSIDIANDRFRDVTVAMVDGKGCVKVRQKIRGPFRNPEVQKASFLQSAAGPVLNLFQRAEKLAGAQCEAFYDGSVAPPK